MTCTVLQPTPSTPAAYGLGVRQIRLALRALLVCFLCPAVLCPAVLCPALPCLASGMAGLPTGGFAGPPQPLGIQQDDAQQDDASIADSRAAAARSADSEIPAAADRPGSTTLRDSGGEPLNWSDLPPLPDPVGLGGPVVGVHGQALIVAGGANFPQGPPWPEDGKPAGDKVWHDRIYVLLPGSETWLDAGRLPHPLAYAATVSTDRGVWVLGGESHDPARKNHPTREVWLLQWDDQRQRVDIVQDALPELPKACRYHAAVSIGQRLFVAASHAASEQSQRLDQKHFWCIDLPDGTAGPATDSDWSELPAWPGAAREKMALVVQNAGANENLASPTCIYLLSGGTWYRDAQGEMDLAGFEHFADNYRFEPDSQTWQRVADLPVYPENRALDSLADFAWDPQARSWLPVNGGVDEAEPQRQEGRLAENPSPTGFPFDDKRPRPAAAAAAIAVGQAHILVFSGATGRYVTMGPQRHPQFPADVLAYHTVTDTWVRAGQMPQAVVTTTAVEWNQRIVIPSGEIKPGVRTARIQALQLQPAANRLGWVNLAILLGYLALLVWIGYQSSRRKQDSQDFFLAGRNMPWWAAGISIYATQLSAITFVSLPAVAYATNWMVYPGSVTIFLFAPIVVFFFLPFFARLNLSTAYEYLERRFDVSVRWLGSLSFILFQLARMAIVVYLPALALESVTGIPIVVCILSMGVLATGYTFVGGIRAVIWTDVAQTLVLWGGMLLAIVLIVVDVGSWSEIWQTARDDGKLAMFSPSWKTTHMAAWLILVGNFALQFGPYTTDQAVVQRYLTTRDERAAACSIWLNGFLVLPFSLLFFVLGTCLFVYFQRHPEFLQLGMQNDQVFPLFMAQRMPVGLAGLVVAGVFAASMSSLDSSLHSIATAVTNDFYRRLVPKASDAACLRCAKGLTLAGGVFGTALALALAGFDIQSLFFLFQKILGLLSSGLVSVFLLGIFWRKASSICAWCGAVASTLVVYLMTFHSQINFFLYAPIGIGTGCLAGIACSLLVPRSSENDAQLRGLTWFTLK